MRSQRDDEKLAYPIEEGRKRIGLGRTKFYEEMKLGRVRTYPVGRIRYVSHEELLRYVREREIEAATETPEQRAAKVAAAVEANARKRAEAAA